MGGGIAAGDGSMESTVRGTEGILAVELAEGTV